MSLAVQPWRFLTTRGRTFLIVGLASSVAALVVDQRDLAWVGLLLALLPVLGLVVVSRSRILLSCERRIVPPRVSLGEPLNATLRLTKTGSFPVGLLRFEDQVPGQLGRRPRFGVHRLAGAWVREVSYPMVGLARGRHRVGPLLVTAVDPFGLVDIQRSFKTSTEVLVAPRVVALGTLHSATGSGRAGDTGTSRIGLVGQDDVMVREYRHGDSVRRVHWRSTARHGELMVRREEQAWDPTAVVLLDNRGSAHAGSGRGGSLEWAVSAAASVCYHLISSGYRVQLVDADGTVHDTTNDDPDAARERLLMALTDLHASRIGSLRELATPTLRSRSGELIVTLTGRLSDEDLFALGSLRDERTQGLAIMIDVESFGAPGQQPSVDHARQLNHLRHAQWRTTLVRRGVSTDEAWRSLDRTGAAA